MDLIAFVDWEIFGIRSISEYHKNNSQQVSLVIFSYIEPSKHLNRRPSTFFPLLNVKVSVPRSGVTAISVTQSLIRNKYDNF